MEGGNRYLQPSLHPDDLQYEDDASNVDLEDDDIGSESIMSSRPPPVLYESQTVPLEESATGDLDETNINNMEDTFVDEDADETLDQVPMIAI